MSEWRDIALAPRDGTKLLCYSPGAKKAVNENAIGEQMRTDRWVLKYHGFAAEYPEARYTHFMFLPDPPK